MEKSVKDKTFRRPLILLDGEGGREIEEIIIRYG
jgi:hypothetical protein